MIFPFYLKLKNPKICSDFSSEMYFFCFPVLKKIWRALTHGQLSMYCQDSFWQRCMPVFSQINDNNCGLQFYIYALPSEEER